MFLQRKQRKGGSRGDPHSSRKIRAERFPGWADGAWSPRKSATHVRFQPMCPNFSSAEGSVLGASGSRKIKSVKTYNMQYL